MAAIGSFGSISTIEVPVYPAFRTVAFTMSDQIGQKISPFRSGALFQLRPPRDGGLMVCSGGRAPHTIRMS
jgi:hypothetical protein